MLALIMAAGGLFCLNSAAVGFCGGHFSNSGTASRRTRSEAMVLKFSHVTFFIMTCMSWMLAVLATVTPSWSDFEDFGKLFHGDFMDFFTRSFGLFGLTGKLFCPQWGIMSKGATSSCCRRRQLDTDGDAGQSLGAPDIWLLLGPHDGGRLVQ